MPKTITSAQQWHPQSKVFGEKGHVIVNFDDGSQDVMTAEQFTATKSTVAVQPAPTMEGSPAIAPTPPAAAPTAAAKPAAK
jgi:hypothetical protein